MKDFTQESIDWNIQINKKCGYVTKNVLEQTLKSIHNHNYNQNQNLNQNLNQCILYYSEPACVCYNYNKSNNYIRVKMICNWCSSTELCKQWSNMCDSCYRWKNIEITSDDKADYYVIINYPLSNDEYYDPLRTIIFQMEPWVADPNKQWGVKTWGTWAKPDESKVLSCHYT